MELSTAIHRIHNTHAGNEAHEGHSLNIGEDSVTNNRQAMSTNCRQQNIPSGFSFIIDDVDADPMTGLSGCNRSSDSLEEIYVKDGGTLVDVDSAHKKEKSDARIQQIKGEAESRKNEFAKLLEEHAQVIKQLKQMEDEPAVSGGEAGPTDI